MSSLRRWGLSALMLCLPLMTLSTGAVRAADDAPETKAEDALVYKTLRDVINEGADMYNAQGRYKNMDRDYAGCFHLYEGALMVTRSLLGRHADLQKAIDDAMASARETPQMEKRAFVLREVIDKIREAVNPKGAAPIDKPMPPIVATPPADKETTVTGKIVNGEKGKLIVLVDGKGKTFTVPDAAKVVINGTNGKLEDLNLGRGEPVTVTSKGDVVTKVEARFESKVTTPPPVAKETTHSGKITKAGADSLTIKTNEDKEVRYSVPATAKILNNGEETKLGDIHEGASVVITQKGDVVTKVEAKSATPPPASTKTLWDRLGGEKNVAKVVDDFVNTAGKDPKVNFWRDPTRVPSKQEVADLKTKLVEFVSSATGGPLQYEGKSMKEAHKGMKITNEEFDAAAKDLKDALVKNGAKAEDVDAVMKAVDGTRKEIVEAKEPEEKTKPEEKKTEEKKTDDKKPEEKGSVNGIVTHIGKPVMGGMVILTDADGKEIKADLGADGTYKLKAKPGQYKVAVDAKGVPEKFHSAKTSALTVDVHKGDNAFDIVLQD
jgi:truncated hemoglobin YjbI